MVSRDTFAHVCMRSVPGKNAAIANVTRKALCNISITLAAKGSGLERACVNNDTFTVLVGGGRC